MFYLKIKNIFLTKFYSKLTDLLAKIKSFIKSKNLSISLLNQVQQKFYYLNPFLVFRHNFFCILYT